MGTNTFAKLMLAAALVLSCSTELRAEPDNCNPKVAMAPPEASDESNFFSRLFGAGEKPEPFSGAVMDDPETGCQSGSQVRSVVSNLRLRDREHVLD